MKTAFIQHHRFGLGHNYKFSSFSDEKDLETSPTQAVLKVSRTY